MELAVAAKQLAEARHHKITDAEVYAAILGVEDEEEQDALLTPLLRDWVEDWLELKVDVATSTHDEYARLLRGRVVPALGDLRVGDIDREADIDPWKARLSKELMPAGVRKHWAVLSMVMRDAVPRYRDDNPLDRQPGRRSNGLPKVEKYNACFLTTEEAQILVANCPDVIRDVVLVALGTGMRLGEILGLRAGAVRLLVGEGEQPVLYVQETLRRSGGFAAPKSEMSRRGVQLSPSMVELFARLIANKRREDLVFTAPGGKPWDANNFRWRYWRQAVAAAGRCSEHPPAPARSGNGVAVDRVGALAVSSCDCPTRLRQRPRFHDLRHSHVAYLIDARWDFFVIQRHIGHASIKTTFDVYGHRLTRGDKQRLKALDERLPGRTVKAHKESVKAKSKSKSKKRKEVSPFIEGLQLAA